MKKFDRNTSIVPMSKCEYLLDRYIACMGLSGSESELRYYRDLYDSTVYTFYFIDIIGIDERDQLLSEGYDTYKVYADVLSKSPLDDYVG